MKRISEIILAVICFPLWITIIPLIDCLSVKSWSFGKIWRFNFNCFVHRLTGNYNIYL